MASEFSRTRIGVYGVMIIAFCTLGGALLALSFITWGLVLIAFGCIALAKAWRFFNQTNRSIAFFFDAVRNNDTTFVFRKKSEAGLSANSIIV